MDEDCRHRITAYRGRLDCCAGGPSMAEALPPAICSAMERSFCNMGGALVPLVAGPCNYSTPLDSICAGLSVRPVLCGQISREKAALSLLHDDAGCGPGQFHTCMDGPFHRTGGIHGPLWKLAGHLYPEECLRTRNGVCHC